MARTFAMNRFYPAPGGASKVDGFNLDLSGDAEFQAMLVQMGPLIIKRAMGICRTLGEELAVKANAAAPRGARQNGRPGGNLARSFGVNMRPQWMQLGKVGVSVRSKASYHHYVEFGVNKPNSRVVRHIDDAGRKVPKGKRYRDGTNRLRDGVRTKGYMRDIIIPANPFFGEGVRSVKSRFETEAREGLMLYISRLAASPQTAAGADVGG